MAKVSLNQAAKDTGVSLSTLSRWRKKGKITAEKNISGGYLLDTSEYDRIKSMAENSPNMQTPEKCIMENFATRDDTPLLQQKIEFLEKQIQDQNQTIKNLEDDKEDYKNRLDKSQEIIKQQTILISDMREKPPQKPAEKRKWFLGIFPRQTA
jgi:DNA-binding transcriptional MerR regulator